LRDALKHHANVDVDETLKLVVDHQPKLGDVVETRTQRGIYLQFLFSMFDIFLFSRTQPLSPVSRPHFLFFCSSNITVKTTVERDYHQEEKEDIFGRNLEAMKEWTSKVYAAPSKKVTVTVTKVWKTTQSFFFFFYYYYFFYYFFFLCYYYYYYYYYFHFSCYS
jgi:cellulose synthase/poly-beta-1,6-N-acetylglucosamine synthase-like glycosyltransferase